MKKVKIAIKVVQVAKIFPKKAKILQINLIQNSKKKNLIKFLKSKNCKIILFSQMNLI